MHVPYKAICSCLKVILHPILNFSTIFFLSRWNNHIENAPINFILYLNFVQFTIIGYIRQMSIYPISS